jgi:putative DNA primase/helicase
VNRRQPSSKRRDLLLEARGRWPGILVAMGVDEKSLTGRHGPCPLPGCGGKDRFRFDDKEGRGTYYCTHCGAGDGIKLVQAIKGLGFKDSLRLVEELMPLAPEIKRAKERTASEKGAALRRMWDEAKPIAKGGVVDRYLSSRCILSRPESLREVAALPYYDDGKRIGAWPAMLARIITADGKGASLHVTWLSEVTAGKAPVEAPKKIMQPVRPIMGASIQLVPLHGDTLGVGEGIETSLSAREQFNVPVWATLNGEGMAAFVWPEQVKHLIVFGDNDKNYAGHKAAYALAFRAAGRGLAVTVTLPPLVGADWNDMWRSASERKAA